MNFLEYSNANHCNIIPQEEFEQLAQSVFGVISENIAKSLGPLGSSATVLDGMLTEATKDGYSILKKYRFHNRYKKMIYNLIMAPCTRMNNTVGDGTTTAIVLANAMFGRYTKYKNTLGTMYRLPRQFTKAWDEVIADIIKYVNENTIMLDPNDYDTIYNIAHVTSNGNDEISKAIAQTYRDSKSPSIKMKDSPTNKSYISQINGFDFPANLISDAFVRNEDLTAEEKDLHIMIFDHKIETDFFTNIIIPINEVLKSKGQKLLIMAPAYDKYMCDTIVDKYILNEYRTKHYINLIMAQYTSKLSEHQLADLSVVLRAKIITQDAAVELVDGIMNGDIDSIIESIESDDKHPFYHFIGFASDAMLSCTNGSIFRATDIEEDDLYKETITRAQHNLNAIIAQTDYEKQSYASKIYEAKARLSQLEMRNFIYYIGADSALQKQIIWDSVEDVIKCVRSAIKSGVVPGCQITIIRACINMMKKIAGAKEAPIYENKISEENKLKFEIIKMIEAAVQDVYIQILHGPEGQGMIKTLDRWQYTTDEGQEALIQAAVDKAISIVNTSIDNNQAFDMETLEYNSAIITSAETDTMVLTAASELVKILISGNQCIFLDSDINESHNDTVEAYV